MKNKTVRQVLKETSLSIKERVKKNVKYITGRKLILLAVLMMTVPAVLGGGYLVWTTPLIESFCWSLYSAYLIFFIIVPIYNEL